MTLNILNISSLNRTSAAMMAIVTKAAMRPYSIAVAAFLFDRKSRNNRN